jgi:hypothetical protein
MRRLVVAALLTSALLPAAAHAQFGGLVRKAAERAIKKDNPSSSSSGQPQIDDATVTHMLTGLAVEAKVADSIGRASLAQNAEVVGQVDAFLKRYAAYAAQRDAERRSQQEYQACIGAPSQELAAMSTQPGGAPPGAMAMAQRMERMSPEEREAFEAKMDKLEKEAKAAEKSGNVAEQQRIRGEIQQLTGMPMSQPAGAGVRSQADVKKMQAAGNRMQQCGMPKPATAQRPEPIMVRPVVTGNGVASLAPSATREIGDSVEAQSYLVSLRGMHVGNEPIVRGAGAAGIPQGQYSLLRERMLYMYAGALLRDDSSHPDGFSEAEYGALQAHRSEILAVAQRLRQLGAF